jgi:hypothetical protein
MPSQKRARAEPELDAPAREPVERCGGLRQEGGRAQREVGHVGEQADALRPAGDEGQERPCVQEAPLIRVVLDADEVQSHALGEEHLVEDAVGCVGLRDRKDAEQRHAHGGGLPHAVRRTATIRASALGKMSSEAVQAFVWLP